MKPAHLPSLLLLLLFSIVITACASVGRPFPEDKVSAIIIGRTTRQEVRTMFGEPWRRGIEDGFTTWTYGAYDYNVLGRRDTSDLIIRFDANGVVQSYSYSTTKKEPQRN